MPPFVIGLIPLRPLFRDLRSDTPLVPTRVNLDTDCERTVMHDRDAEGKLAWVRDVVLRPHVLYTPGSAEQIARVRGDALDEIRGYVTGQSQPTTVPANEDGLAQCITFALSLMKALPSDVPMPSVCFDPDGAISLDWMFSKQRMFSVSVMPSGALAFAGTVDGASWHGTVQSSADGVQYPREILAGIRWAMPQRRPEGIE